MTAESELALAGMLRLYAADECGPDGYPVAWHETIKYQVRAEAFDRCVRCKHPYEAGAGEWSPCDQFCEHQGPLRGRDLDGPGIFDLDCERDNVTAGEWAELGKVEAQWRILTVHHLTGCWGNEQEAKRDCRWWNPARALPAVSPLHAAGRQPRPGLSARTLGMVQALRGWLLRGDLSR